MAAAHSSRFVPLNQRALTDGEAAVRRLDVPGAGTLCPALPAPTCARGHRAARKSPLRYNSSVGKERSGGISKQGDRYLRQMLVVGALALIRYAERHGSRRPWLVQLMARRTTKVAAVALANKTARMIWAVMTSGQPYREPRVGTP
jgi:transposase